VRTISPSADRSNGRRHDDCRLKPFLLPNRDRSPPSLAFLQCAPAKHVNHGRGLERDWGVLGDQRWRPAPSQLVDDGFSGTFKIMCECVLLGCLEQIAMLPNDYEQYARTPRSLR
jgi:hypothetical protein